MSELSERLHQARAGRTIDAVVELTHKIGKPLGRATVARLFAGTHGDVKPSTLEAIGEALQVDIRELRELAGKPAGELGPYVPVDAAGSLTQQQRDAMDQLIMAIVEGDTSWSGNTSPEDKQPSGGGTVHQFPQSDDEWRREHPGMRTTAARKVKMRPADDDPEVDVPPDND